MGPRPGEKADYPDQARLVAEAVAAGRARFGILVCGTGIGMSIAANKVRGIRAAVCTTEFEARMARAHNDANVLCLGERVIGPGVCDGIVRAFLADRLRGRPPRRAGAEDRRAAIAEPLVAGPRPARYDHVARRLPREREVVSGGVP